MKVPKYLLATISAAFLLWMAFPGGSIASAADKKLTGYDVLRVEQFTVEETDRTIGFTPRMVEGMRQEVIDRLLGERLFDDVIGTAGDDPDSPNASSSPAAETEAASTGKQLLLSGTVTEFKKGSRAKRFLIGFGSGASVVKVLFTFRDSQTGKELLRKERKGKYSGWLSFAGGQEREALDEAAGDVVDGLIKEIKKNR